MLLLLRPPGQSPPMISSAPSIAVGAIVQAAWLEVVDERAASRSGFPEFRYFRECVPRGRRRRVAWPGRRHDGHADECCAGQKPLLHDLLPHQCGTGIREMTTGSGASMNPFGVFDKAVPSRG